MSRSALRMSLGVMFRHEEAPEALASYARRAEIVGLDELWVVEDCFFGGVYLRQR